MRPMNPDRLPWPLTRKERHNCSPFSTRSEREPKSASSTSARCSIIRPISSISSLRLERSFNEYLQIDSPVDADRIRHCVLSHRESRCPARKGGNQADITADIKADIKD